MTETKYQADLGDSYGYVQNSFYDAFLEIYDETEFGFRFGRFILDDKGSPIRGGDGRYIEDETGGEPWRLIKTKFIGEHVFICEEASSWAAARHEAAEECARIAYRRRGCDMETFVEELTFEDGELVAIDGLPIEKWASENGASVASYRKERLHPRPAPPACTPGFLLN